MLLGHQSVPIVCVCFSSTLHIYIPLIVIGHRPHMNCLKKRLRVGINLDGFGHMHEVRLPMRILNGEWPLARE